MANERFQLTLGILSLSSLISIHASPSSIWDTFLREQRYLSIYQRQMIIIAVFYHFREKDN